MAISTRPLKEGRSTGKTIFLAMTEHSGPLETSTFIVDKTVLSFPFCSRTSKKARVKEERYSDEPCRIALVRFFLWSETIIKRLFPPVLFYCLFHFEYVVTLVILVNIIILCLMYHDTDQTEMVSGITRPLITFNYVDNLFLPPG